MKSIFIFAIINERGSSMVLQVSRANNLKIPKTVENIPNSLNSKEDKQAVKESVALANDQKISLTETVMDDEELKRIEKIPFNANDLIVITVVKKLGAYVIAITEKSPKKFRGVFVNRMQNYCLDALEYLLEANFIRMDSEEHKKKREDFQKEAIVKLKLLGYVSMVAETSGCILKRQYKEITRQLAEGINLIGAWKKSDDVRFQKRK